MQMQKIYPFSLPLTQSIKVHEHTLSSRDGFLIEIHLYKDGISGFGECLPLPGFHKENLSICLDQAKDVLKIIKTENINFDQFNFTEPFFGILEIPIQLYPSLEFAIEQALLSLYLQFKKSAVKDLFGIHEMVFSTPVNGVLIPDEKSKENAELITKQALMNGFSVLKMKVGRFPMEDEISLIKKITEYSQGSLEFRLDGNCLFDENSFQDFSDRLRDTKIEYIEEPLKLELSVSSRKTYDGSPLPIALDESLPFYLEELTHGHSLPKSVTAIVIKPTTLGGIHKTVRLIKLANQSSLKCILSSAFDSGYSIGTYAFLSQLSKKPSAMGLDTYKFLSKDLLKTRLHYQNGKLWMPEKFFNMIEFKI